MTPEQYHDYELWRERRLLDPPDVSIEAYLHHLEAEAALEAIQPKEITA